MTARVRRWSAKTTIAATYASTGVVLLALALLVAFLLQPPLLGWVGFAVVLRDHLEFGDGRDDRDYAHALQPAVSGRGGGANRSADKTPASEHLRHSREPVQNGFPEQ